MELVAHNSATGNKTANIWKEGPIPIEHAIRGFYSVTLSEEGYECTASVLTDGLGFVPTRQDGNRFRYEIPTTHCILLLLNKKKNKSKIQAWICSLLNSLVFDAIQSREVFDNRACLSNSTPKLSVIFKKFQVYI